MSGRTTSAGRTLGIDCTALRLRLDPLPPANLADSQAEFNSASNDTARAPSYQVRSSGAHPGPRRVTTFWSHRRGVRGLFRTTSLQKSCEKSWRGVAAFRSTQSFYSSFDERYQLTTAKSFSVSSTCRCPRLSPWLSSTSSGVRAGTSGKTGRPPGSHTLGARDR